ncbi:acyltransferase family protein [Dietzia aerolata]|uniref:acyltransferase family protein n=1 Tax=Dietzia aerolata TaxID=595984 RepID=UPI00363AF861
MAYRHDIDGLRGLAIALVVVFHIWMGRVSGGVDVFLTLSGFFFLGSLLRGTDNPRTPLNPLPHLKRLVRRLYPALVVTIAATMLGTILIKPPPSGRRSSTRPSRRCSTTRTGSWRRRPRTTPRPMQRSRRSSICGRCPSRVSSIWWHSR